MFVSCFCESSLFLLHFTFMLFLCLKCFLYILTSLNCSIGSYISFVLLDSCRARTDGRCRKDNYCSFHKSLSNTFWRTHFYFFLFLAETYRVHVCVNVLYVTRNRLLVGSDKKWEISPKTPIVKTADFSL